MTNKIDKKIKIRIFIISLSSVVGVILESMPHIKSSVCLNYPVPKIEFHHD